MHKAGINIPSSDYIGGLGGKNISDEEIEQIFTDLAQQRTGVHFIGIGGGQSGS